MAVAITAPNSRVINRSNPIQVSWTAEYPQSAYEILYRRKGTEAWSTLGRTDSTANSAQLDLSAFDDFTEYHYRVVCYSDDAADGTTIYSGSDSSAAYSLVVVPAAKLAAMKVRYGDKMVEVPIYDKTGIGVKISLPSGKRGEIALGSTDSAIASELRTNTGSGVKAALGTEGKFAASGINAGAYMAVNERYGYSYAEPNYSYSYRYSWTNPTYTYSYRYSWTNARYYYLVTHDYVYPYYYYSYSYDTYSTSYQKHTYSYLQKYIRYMKNENRYTYYGNSYSADFHYTYNYSVSVTYYWYSNDDWYITKYGYYYTKSSSITQNYAYRTGGGGAARYSYYTSGGGGTSYGYRYSTGGGGTSYGYRYATGNGGTLYGYGYTTAHRYV